MEKIINELEIILPLGPFQDKVIIDVGCGTGDLVRELTSRGARVTGIDTCDMIAKAKVSARIGDEVYLIGGGENLPFENNVAEMIVFFASLHHLPAGQLNQGLREAHRVLKSGGIVFCLEPVGQKGSYFELISLVEDERNIQSKAYEAIQNASNIGFKHEEEFMVYFERSYEDYVKLLKIFVDDDARRNEYLAQAEQITEHLSVESGMDLKDFRYRSVCRVNVLKKV